MGGMCGWESSLKFLHPVTLLNLVTRVPWWAPTLPATSHLGTLKPGQGGAQASVPWRGETTGTGVIRSMDGLRRAESGRGRDAGERAASLPRGPQWHFQGAGAQGSQGPYGCSTVPSKARKADLSGPFP